MISIALLLSVMWIVCIWAYNLLSIFDSFGIRRGRDCLEKAADGECDIVGFLVCAGINAGDFISDVAVAADKASLDQSSQQQWTLANAAGTEQGENKSDEKKTAETTLNAGLQRFFQKVPTIKLNTGVACFDQGEATMTVVSYGKLTVIWTTIRERGAGVGGPYNEDTTRFDFFDKGPYLVGDNHKADVLPVLIDRLFVEMRRYYLADCIHIYVRCTDISRKNKNHPQLKQITIGKEEDVYNPKIVGDNKWFTVKVI